MLINSANLALFFTGLSATFFAAYDSAAPHWNEIATFKGSSTKYERMAWMEKVPTMRQWVGQRVIANLVSRDYMIENIPWELTLEVDKWDIQQDQYGVYAPMVSAMGQQAALWPDYMIADAMRLNSKTAYDGAPYFDDAHSVELADGSGTATWDNNMASTAFSPENFQAARKHMMLFVGQDNRPMGIRPSHIFAGPSLEIAILNVLNATFIAPQLIGGNTQVGANDNVLRGIAKPVIWEQLESTAAGIDGTEGLGSGDPDPAKTWYLADCGKAIKPFIFQQFQAPVFIPRQNPQDPSVFDRAKFVYGVEANGNSGVTLPFLCLRAYGGVLS